MGKPTGLPAVNPAHTFYLHYNTLYNGTLMPHYYPLSTLSSVHKVCHCDNHFRQSVVVIVSCLPLVFVSLSIVRVDGVKRQSEKHSQNCLTSAR